MTYTNKEAAEILEGELKSLSSARGSDYSGVLALEHAISVLQELPDEQAVRPNIRQEMAQKCRNDAWGQQVVSTVAESMNKVISGINSTEICNQIVSDNLRNWCERTQCKLRIAMNYMPYRGKALSSAQSEQPEISYKDCADATLKMWIDNVLTDGEYIRIMDKLNAHWVERREE